ncbi:MAG: KTSC domain-containing protein [Candidatus Methylophosphatis roskildensis]
MAIEMKKVSSGKLRAIGYDAGARVLQVEFDDGRLMQYQSVGQELWRRLSSSSAMSSYFRDNIEEELTSRRIR